MFTSTVVAPRLPNADGDPWSCRKYLVAAPGGRLMVVLEDSKEITDEYYGRLRTCSFKVQILDADGEQWKETDDIGDAALFVGVNSSMCVSTREHPEIRAGCVYYTENDVGPCNDAYDQSGVGVFNLKDGRAEKVQGLGQHRNWPPPAWFIPSFQ
ncbi:putative F-box protein At5g60060 [Triticum dicoccoides]|uniref:putative F-box protein At5g60060 n=1 Tax=Triticum dicoccoides TaxID=85692 RepID=UPI00188DDEDE|nr:putative F-box protein At5g60060 [Triticum dicoccoides]